MKETSKIIETAFKKKKTSKRQVADSCGRIAIVASVWNQKIVSLMQSSAQKALAEAGVDKKSIAIYTVPGAWEIPQMASKLYGEQKCDALLALGSVIRGETIHFDLTATQSTQQLLSLATSYQIPTIAGILATEDEKQAMERADPKRYNYGRELAFSLLLLCRTWNQY